jgi:hypothetical protein
MYDNTYKYYLKMAAINDRDGTYAPVGLTDRTFADKVHSANIH